jgi:signal peptidase II
MKRHLPFLLFVAGGLMLDLATKALAFERLAWGDSYRFIPDVLHFTLARNTGVAFSFLAGQTELILAITATAITVLLLLYRSALKERSTFKIAVTGMLLAGALGNFYDRARFGFVRDFIDFVPELPLVGHWAVFNIADVCITGGVILFLFYEFFLRPAPVEEPSAGASNKPESTHA